MLLQPHPYQASKHPRALVNTRVIQGVEHRFVISKVFLFSAKFTLYDYNVHKSGDGDGSRAMYTVRLFYFLTFEGTPRANWRESGKT